MADPIWKSVKKIVPINLQFFTCEFFKRIMTNLMLILENSRWRIQYGGILLKIVPIDLKLFTYRFLMSLITKSYVSF